jgi:hypothetical protein
VWNQLLGAYQAKTAALLFDASRLTSINNRLGLGNRYFVRRDGY